MKDKKPVVLLGDDGSDYCKETFHELSIDGNEVVIVRNLEDILKELHDVVPERPRLAIFLTERFPGLNAVLLYLKNAVSHRVMTCVLASKPAKEDQLGDWRKQKEHWQNEGVFYVFDKDGVETFENVVGNFSHSPFWRLIEELLRDRLTGLDNVEGFCHTVVPQLVTMRDRKGDDFEIAATVLAIDADKFKSINDTHGHLVGTEAIISLAEALRSHVRAADIVCRYGGDEFLVFLPGTTKVQAIPIARHLQKAVSAVELFDQEKRRVCLSISVGVAEIWRYEIGEDAMSELNKLIHRADVDLYEVKRGRDDSGAE